MKKTGLLLVVLLCPIIATAADWQIPDAAQALLERMAGAKFMTAAAVSSVAAPADPVVRQIVVQCQDDGPAYSGTLSIPAAFKAKCNPNSGGQPYIEDSKEDANIVLSFNDLNYRMSNVGNVWLLFADAACTPTNFIGFDSAAWGVERQSSFTASFTLQAANGRFYGKIGRCAFATR